MPMANAAKGYFFKLFGNAAMSARAVKALGDADRVFAENGATDRERLHLEALRAWCAEDLDVATAHWERILLDHPKDHFTLSLAPFPHFYPGETREMRTQGTRVLPALAAC